MIKNFIVDRVVRGNMYDTKTGELLWSLNQIQSPSLNMESETVEATDALGTPIMSFDRSKSCTFSAENAIFDLSLLAEQVGTEAKTEVRNVPVFETLNVKNNEVTLSKTPVDAVAYVYVVNGDGSLGTEYAAKKEDPAETPDFTISGKKITFNVDVTDDTQIFASYEYEGKATYVMNSATNFPKAGKFVMEVLGRDVCDSTTEIYAMLVLPSAKLSASTDISFETEMTQGFELTAQQNYCSATNELFTLIIPED
jgi:hypothetical protein